MLQFSLRPFDTPKVNSNSLACLELLAFFAGKAKPSELELDDDQATEWYIEHIVPETDREAYSKEFRTAGDEMTEWFSRGLQDMVRERIAAMGPNYPFALESTGEITLKTMQELSPVSLCYIALQFHRVLTNELIDVLGADEAGIAAQEREFLTYFADLFEYIAGYAVSGKEPGIPYMTSHCRSANALHGVLVAACRRIGGGVVRPVDQWGLEQLETNDGKVDCIVHAHGPGVPGNARLFLVGASLQKTAIEGKIMDPNKLNFFGGFFQNRPAVFQGVLVRPQDETALTRNKCIERSCLLYSYDEIWRGFAGVTKGHNRNQASRLLDLKARHLLRSLQGVAMLHLGSQHAAQVDCAALM